LNPTLRQVQSSAQDIVVLDNGGTSIRIGHVKDGVIGDEFETISSKALCVANAYDALAAIIRNYSSAHSLSLEAAVLGIPGMLDQAADTITHCNNIPQLEGTGLRSHLESSLGCHVILEQDIMLQLRGESSAGAARDSDSVFGVYFGTGIGAAYLLNGMPFPSHQGAAGLQAGHIPIMAQGKRCMCGNTDCIEAYACGHTLTELAATSDCPVERLFVERDNSELAEPLNQFILYQAYMLASIVTLFVPDTILIGGGIPQMKNYPRDELLEKVREHLQKPQPAESVKFRWSSLGKHAPMHGALALLNIRKNTDTRHDHIA